MEDPKDSLTFEILGFKVSAVGRFAVVCLLILAFVVMASAVVVGPAQVRELLANEEKPQP